MAALFLIVALLGQSTDVLPGESHATPATASLVLRSGPSANHPGVLTLEADSVVRRGSTDREYVPVYVAQGFPVYLHADYVAVDERTHQVRVLGQRVNARLLPATQGLLPLGQLGADSGPLQLLDLEGRWVRVLAPLGLPLYASKAELSDDPSEAAASRWTSLHAQRSARLARSVEAWKATDPEWVRDRALADEVASLRTVTLTDLAPDELAQRRTTLEGLGRRVAREELRNEVVRMLQDVATEESRREAALLTIAEIQRDQAREAASLVREARALDFGLRFLGKGEALTVEGLVTRRSSEETEAAVYSIRGADGRQFKLSAAKEIALLKGLLGKQVVLQGRSLDLVNVDGPVLIVDEVTKVSVP